MTEYCIVHLIAAFFTTNILFLSCNNLLNAYLSSSMYPSPYHMCDFLTHYSLINTVSLSANQKFYPNVIRIVSVPNLNEKIFACEKRSSNTNDSESYTPESPYAAL